MGVGVVVGVVVVVAVAVAVAVGVGVVVGVAIKKGRLLRLYLIRWPRDLAGLFTNRTNAVYRRKEGEEMITAAHWDSICIEDQYEAAPIGAQRELERALAYARRDSQVCDCERLVSELEAMGVVNP